MDNDEVNEQNGGVMETCAGVITRQVVNEREKKNVYAGFMDRWPILFKQKNLPMTQTCMCWGIECPPGWKSILERLFNKIETINLTLGRQWEFEVQAVQCKEKYGTLRLYYDVVSTYNMDDAEHVAGHDEKWLAEQQVIIDTVDNDVEKMIRDAENETSNCCSECGIVFGDWNKDDRVVTNGWITIFCSKCAKKHGHDPEELKKFWKDLKEKNKLSEMGNTAS